MPYKLSEEPLRLREFGRNLQGLIDFAVTVEDREVRNRVANEIIRIMVTLNPALKENPEYKQKIWDALIIMSDFKLDVDSPFPLPKPEEFNQRPTTRVAYFKGRPKLRQYGYNIQQMIQKALEMDDMAKRTAYLNQIAGTMKLFLRSADREGANEDHIAEHIRELSGGRLNVKGEDLTISKSYSTVPLNNPQNSKTNNRHKNSNSNNSNNNRGGHRNKRRRK
jgi:Domain of unknown function (DUF4290)